MARKGRGATKGKGKGKGGKRAGGKGKGGKKGGAKKGGRSRSRKRTTKKGGKKKGGKGKKGKKVRKRSFNFVDDTATEPNQTSIPVETKQEEDPFIGEYGQEEELEF